MTLCNLEKKRLIEPASASHGLSNSKDTVRLVKRQNKRTCFIVGFLLLVSVVKLFNVAHSWSLSSSKPRFPFPRRHMSAAEREQYFL